MKHICLTCAIILTIAPARADTIRLNTAKNLTGHVLSYANMTFEVEDDAGKTTRYSSASITSIAFSKEGVPATLEIRNKGNLERTITDYQKGAFSATDGTGKTEKIPAMMIVKATFGGGSSKKFMLVTGGGKVDMKKLLAPGKVTIVDFFADWCGPCKQIGPQLEKLSKEDSNVVLRKVDIVRWGTPVTTQFDIKGIPRIQIYDRKGNLIGTVSGAGIDKVQSFVTTAKEAK